MQHGGLVVSTLTENDMWRPGFNLAPYCPYSYSQKGIRVAQTSLQGSLWHFHPAGTAGQSVTAPLYVVTPTKLPQKKCSRSGGASALLKLEQMWKSCIKDYLWRSGMHSDYLWESQRRGSIVAQEGPVGLQRGQVGCWGRLKASNCEQEPYQYFS